MVKCITSSRFTMLADVLVMVYSDQETFPLSEYGHPAKPQNPRSGRIERRWAPLVNNAGQQVSIPCVVKPLTRIGTVEAYGQDYENNEMAIMNSTGRFPVSERIQVTNVRNMRTKQILWRDTQLELVDGQYPATIFDIQGVVPQLDPFGNLIEYRSTLTRADQSG